MATAREHAANTEKLGEVGAVVASTLERETIVQKVTDIATELTHAEFGAFFYNVTDPESGDAYMLYTLSGAPREAFAQFPASACDGRVRADVSRRGAGPAGRRDRRIRATERARRISGCRLDTCRSGATWRCR